MKDIATSNLEFLQSKFGIIGEQLWRHANGIDDADIHEEYVPKERSLSLGQVLFRDYNKSEMTTIIREMVDDLSSRMRNQGKKAHVVSLFIGYSRDKGGFARRMTLPFATDDTRYLLDGIFEIYNRNIKNLPIRRVSICFGGLAVSSCQQLCLFEDEKEQIRRQDLQRAVDILHSKYGKNSILRASALLEESTIRERNGLIGGHRR